MSDALTAVEQIYINAQLGRDKALAACKTQAQRDSVMSNYVATRKNYFACINKVFHDDDPALKTLVTQANTVAGELKTINDHLGDITKILGWLTDGVEVGAKIAALV